MVCFIVRSLGFCCWWVFIRVLMGLVIVLDCRSVWSSLRKSSEYKFKIICFLFCGNFGRLFWLRRFWVWGSENQWSVDHILVEVGSEWISIAVSEFRFFFSNLSSLNWNFFFFLGTMFYLILNCIKSSSKIRYRLKDYDCKKDGFQRRVKIWI